MLMGDQTFITALVVYFVVGHVLIACVGWIVSFFMNVSDS